MNRNKNGLVVLAICLLITSFSQAQTVASQQMRQLINKNFRDAADQYKVLMQKVPADSMPRSFDPKTGRSINSNRTWWCSGFYPGSLLYIYEYTKDATIKEEALKKLRLLEPTKYHTRDHDLGFMMFCSFGNAYRILATPAYKEVILTSAQSLSTRYRPSIKAIQSWDSSKTFKCPVIIDNMMNLELLEWASRNGGDKTLGDIAVTHANTTIKNHFRPDYSSYHVVDYNLATGGIWRKATAQGAADSSAWARGQSWGLYGYTMMYRFTKDPAYLSQARHIAAFLLHHKRLPSDDIPYWDFDAPGIPDTYRDASAGAVMASALLELGQYVKGGERKQYIAAAEKIIRALSSAQYKAATGSNGGFLLMHSVGSIPHGSEVDVPLTYADYYFLEAMLRYKKWYL